MGETFRNFLELSVLYGFQWFLLAVTTTNVEGQICSHTICLILASLEGNVNHCNVYVCPPASVHKWRVFRPVLAVQVGCLCVGLRESSAEEGDPNTSVPG